MVAGPAAIAPPDRVGEKPAADAVGSLEEVPVPEVIQFRRFALRGGPLGVAVLVAGLWLTRRWLGEPERVFGPGLAIGALLVAPIYAAWLWTEIQLRRADGEPVVRGHLHGNLAQGP